MRLVTDFIRTVITVILAIVVFELIKYGIHIGATYMTQQLNSFFNQLNGLV